MIRLILPERPSSRLKLMLDKFLDGKDYRTIRRPQEIGSLRDKKIIFAIELPLTGQSSGLNDIFIELFKHRDSLKNSQAVILISSQSILHTRSYSQHIIYNANLLGCSFIGRPIVEASKDLINLKALEKVYGLDRQSILLKQTRELADRFFNDEKRKIAKPKLLLVHSSHVDSSNSYGLWKKVKSNISNLEVKEINLWGQAIEDCVGCSYRICKAKGMEESCIYKDLITEELYPSLVEADGLILVCPNYNDMLNANLVAMINRMTAIFRKYKFYDKKLFSIIVSGHSGIEAVAKQIISSLNINKTFKLAPNFSLYAQANEPNTIDEFPNIDKLAKNFALHIEKELETI